jgi:UDP-glucose 4-epimerase
MGQRRHVIVTGGAGFIGSHLAARLLDAGHEVTVLDNLSTGRLANIPAGADFIEMDLGREEEYGLLDGLAGDAVFHLAGQSSGEASFYDPLGDLRSHVLSTFWLLKWCLKKQLKRFIYASSMSIYGEPQYLPVDEVHPQGPKTFYGAGKMAAEAYIKLYQTLGIETTIFRLFSVYGPGQNLENKMQGMISIYLSFLLEGRPILVKGSKERFRDFVYVDDVVEAWLAAWDNPRSYGKVYNVASGQKTRVADLIEALKQALGCPGHPVEYQAGTPGDQFGIVGQNAAITWDLQWQPRVGLAEGLKRQASGVQGRLRGEWRK